jgi:hypothetical protein
VKSSFFYLKSNFEATFVIFNILKSFKSKNKNHIPPGSGIIEIFLESRRSKISFLDKKFINKIFSKIVYQEKGPRQKFFLPTYSLPSSQIFFPDFFIAVYNNEQQHLDLNSFKNALKSK